MALKELELVLGDDTFCIKQLPLAKSQEVLVKLLSLLGGGPEGISEDILATLPQRLRVEDLNFFRDRMFGEHCLRLNESGNWVPMGKALVEAHFAGRLGAMLHLLARCIMHNFTDFLADIRPDDLTGATDPE